MARPATDITAPDNVALAGEPCLVTTQFRREAHEARETREASVATHVFHPSRPMGSIGDYDLAQQLGRSMFVGIHRATGQAFAIRLLDPPAQPDLLGRQLSAARSFASIDHPNVVRTIEVGLHEGHVYIVMEHLRGTPLEVLLELHGALSSAQAIRIAAHVARGLEAAHQRGVVHRSLDASSVIVVPSPCGLGDIKLVDFGLAPADDAVRIARHSMSPELVGGGRVDHRTDLYSLGVLLHRACTLKYPFEGSSIDILAMYRFRSMMRPAAELVGVPRELAGTIERCLAVEPAQRFQTAGEVLQALRAAAGELAQPAASSDVTPPGMVRGEITEVPGREVGPQGARASRAPRASRDEISQPTARGSAPQLAPQPAPQPSWARATEDEERARSGRVMAPVDPASDASGEVIAPSGPARVATALALDASRSAALPAAATAAAASRRGVATVGTVRRGAVWVPVSILAVAFAVGALLSLFTSEEGGGAQVAEVAAPAAPAAAAPAAAPPAPPVAPPVAAPAVLGCPPALEPDVVLSADLASTPAPAAAPAPAVAPTPTATLPEPEATPRPVEATPSSAPAAEEPPPPAPRKSRSRKAKASAKATAERRAKRAEAKRAARPAADEPVSGETIDVSDEDEDDERPRSRRRRE